MKLITAVVAAILFLFAAKSLGTPETGDRQPPNVVLIISDDQRWTDYGFMGHPVIRTPHLDRLADRSLLFPRGYLPTALCRPSLATIVTGLYPHQHGRTGNDPRPDKPPELRRRLIETFDSLPTLPRLLGEHGYLSFQSGKWWEGSYERGGFTHGMTEGFGNHPDGRHGDVGLRIGRETMRPIADFIDRAKKEGKPFFLWYAPFLPHRPHDPPERFLRHYTEPDRPEAVAKYYGMCEWFDATVGKLLGHLEERGLTDNTLVVYLADNGWIQKPNGGFARRSKGSPFDAGVRTPIMLSLPGRIDPRRSEALASSIDIAPTILSVCGVEPPRDLPGIDLLDREARRRRNTVFGAAYAITRIDLDDPAATRQYRWCVHDEWKLLLRDDGRTGSYGWVFDWDRAPVRLYNIVEDPHETKNLAAARPGVVKALRKRIERWRPSAGERD